LPLGLTVELETIFEVEGPSLGLIME
jgi:hypothetical protein